MSFLDAIEPTLLIPDRDISPLCFLKPLRSGVVEAVFSISIHITKLVTDTEINRIRRAHVRLILCFTVEYNLLLE